MEPILTNEAKQNMQASLHGENALYHREIETMAVHNPAGFDPELWRRIQIADAEKDKRIAARAERQNCRIGAKYPAHENIPPAQAKAIHYKGDCVPGVPCTTGGGHGSIEWCGECEKVV